MATNIVLNSDLGRVILSHELQENIRNLVAPQVGVLERSASRLSLGLGEAPLLDKLVPILNDQYQPLVKQSRSRGLGASFRTTVAAHLRMVMEELGYYGQEIGGQIGYSYWKPTV